MIRATEIVTEEPTRGGKKDERMIQFMHDAVATPIPQGVDGVARLDNQINDTLEWIARRSDDEIIAHREAQITKIEKLAKHYEDAGIVDEWFKDTEEGVRKISQRVNGPLWTALLKQTVYEDPGVAETFRQGAPLVEKLEPIGEAKRKEYPEARQLQKVMVGAGDANRQLLSSIKQDANADFLHQQVIDDAGLHRMTSPMMPEELDLDGVILARRFSREQGLKADGTVKKRAVDDETGSGINEATQPTSKMFTDTVEDLIALALLCMIFAKVGISFWKADIDSAFRRIPIMPKHRNLAWVAYRNTQGKTQVAGHLAMPFGAVSSVHAWERIGAAIRYLARVLLRLPVFRFVDDFYSAEKATLAQHAKDCFARLVRALMGADAIAEKKLEYGNPLTVLGIDVEAGHEEVRATVNQEKAQCWSNTLKAALDQQVPTMAPSDAGKMAGRLSFAARSTFRFMGRAMVKPFYAQQYAATGRKAKGGAAAILRMGPDLRAASEWWIEILKAKWSESRRLNTRTEVVELFCDASSTPPHVAAVLLKKGRLSYTDMPVPQELMDRLPIRKDKQIMALEILAIALGLSTFHGEVAGAVLRIWTDNVGCELSIKRGSSKREDHNLMVHAIWLMCARKDMTIWLERVPTDDNISDCPSRQDYRLLQQLGAVWAEPKMEKAFLEPDDWRNVALT